MDKEVTRLQEEVSQVTVAIIHGLRGHRDICIYVCMTTYGAIMTRD